MTAWWHSNEAFCGRFPPFTAYVIPPPPLLAVTSERSLNKCKTHRLPPLESSLQLVPRSELSAEDVKRRKMSSAWQVCGPWSGAPRYESWVYRGGIRRAAFHLSGEGEAVNPVCFFPLSFCLYISDSCNPGTWRPCLRSTKSHRQINASF
jgi:hypothetical protein